MKLHKKVLYWLDRDGGLMFWAELHNNDMREFVASWTNVGWCYGKAMEAYDKYHGKKG